MNRSVHICLHGIGQIGTERSLAMEARWAQFEKVGGPEEIDLVEGEVVLSSSAEVIVEMRAAGLNRAELMHLGGYYVVPTVPPCRMGIEGVGVVAEVGGGVASVDVGDEVVVLPDMEIGQHGTLGSHVAVPERALEAKPSGLDFVDVAALWVAHGTAYAGLVQDGGLVEGGGQVVVISAASSSVGLAALQVARRFGATTIATTRTTVKQQRLLEAGADHVVVTDDQDPGKAILDITGGNGFDIAFDSVAGPWIESLAAAAAQDARLIIYGGQSGQPTPMPVLQMLTSNLGVSALHFVFDALRNEDRRSEIASHLLDGVSSGAYAPAIDSTFDLSEVRSAYERMASNDQFGKIVVTI